MRTVCGTETYTVILRKSSRREALTEFDVRFVFSNYQSKDISFLYLRFYEISFTWCCGLCRKTGENDSTRRIKTEFLVQMQGVGNDTTGVLVLAATNIPWDLDPALRRRFERRVYIPLPEEQARATMFKIHIGNTPNNLTKECFGELAKLTDGYSGSDISIVVRNALMEPVRTCQMATHFKKVSGPNHKDPKIIENDLLTPCSPSDPEGIEMSLEEVPGDKLLVPILTRIDFIKSLKTAKASVGKDDLTQFEKWTAEFGQDGNV